MWFSVRPNQRHREHMKRYAEFVSFDPSGNYATLKVVEDKKEVLFKGICKTQLEDLSLDDEIEVQHLKGNGIEVRGAVASIVPNDYSVYKDLDPEIWPLLNRLEAIGQRVKRIDFFGGEITAQLADNTAQSISTKKMGNPLQNVYALRKWFSIKGQSWGPLEGSK